MATVQTGIATEFINFTRASNATVTDSDGKVKWAPHNLLTNSESFDASAWGKDVAGSATANTVVAPNGTTTADTLTDSATASQHRAYQTITVPSGVQVTLSVYLKNGTRRYARVGLNNTDDAFVIADLQNGTLAAGTNTTSWVISGSSITPVGNNWYLVSLTAAKPSTTTYYPLVATCDVSTTSNNGYSYTGNGSTIHVWGAHLYRSDLAMQPNTSAYPMYNPTTPKNLLGYTEDFSNAAWTKVNIAAFGSGSVSNAILAPNGLQTADSVLETVTNGAHQVFQSVTANNATYVFSVYIKANGRDYCALAMSDGSSGDAAIGVDLINGTTFSVSAFYGASSWTNVSAAITSSGNGFYRVSLTATKAAGTVINATIRNMSSNTVVAGSFSYAGDITKGLYLWGAQLSDSASLDSYVPVYGAAVTSAAYYGPRRDFDPVTLACKGLLVEEQRTNLIRYSRTLETTSSYWGNLSSGTANTITIDNAPGPDGLSTSASMITYNTAVTGAGTFSLWRHSLATTANGTYTFTIWLKAGTTSSVYLRFGDNAGNRANTLCTLTSSWQKFTVTGTTAASISSIGCDVGADGNAGGQTMTAGTVYAYGAQLELGGFATSYVPNGSAVAGATRLADVVSVSTQAFPYSSTEGTWVANFQTIYTGAAPLSAWIVGADNSNSKRIMYMPATDDRVRSFDGSTEIIATGDATGAITKSAAAFGPTDRALVTNGGTVATGAVAAGYGTASVATLGSSNSLSALNGHIRQITYLPRRISNTELQTRTA